MRREDAYAADLSPPIMRHVVLCGAFSTAVRAKAATVSHTSRDRPELERAQPLSKVRKAYKHMEGAES